MIKFEVVQPCLVGPRASVYEFARKYRLSDVEAERLFLKMGASGTQEAVLAEAQFAAPEFKISSDKDKQS
ncbi:hypothetical protein Rleg4DRAFT_6962 [Rhizobium leguminosarum bv. trifolii WSM2297]|uniref:Uncharacterized protein n=1 Tax=Rhizobium leguminosarum bv. trifolii WSM2297 TaxID=754762 RepID=J0CI88_RHILT|nr:hypothetical protein [Rhizobium leguminosarum]EJC83307.1 hypothetical protein Rleg4DRAFT_5059 [Rhizobium leguminosarum bv. trifolii WSM2297]EJC85099.1 hypothetical protein Rleg4DRAFT_6962 [Rhizobium leguminosarum bv. trifolii WSM2297]